MCILCVLSRWSRRFVTMLPWLVIPFIITWAFSQLLPPGYRLEVTSTRLACLGVLLSSLAWYELLVPWLSSWRARRNALVRERKLIEAQEAAKWRKEATRRCRNCFTAYKVQTPGGGKFTCTFCGHVSKRPVLEIPHLGAYPTAYIGHGPGMSASIKGPLSLRREMGCWSRASERRGCAWFGESSQLSEHCRAWRCVFAAFSLIRKLFSFLASMWDHLRESGSSNGDGSRHSQKMKDEMGSVHSSKGEKARRKADEKRQARLEKELLEAEERKQREDVARLVEERRRQREEKLQIEKESEKEAAAEKEREMRRVRETERRRKDKMKERNAGNATEILSADPGTQPLPSTGIQNCEDSVPSKASVASMSMKLADSLKSAKVSKTLRQQQGLKSKSTTDYLSKFGLTKVVKHGSNPAIKMVGSFAEKNGVSIADNKAIGLRSKSNADGVNAPMSENSQVGPKIIKESVWKNSPWSKSNVWTKTPEAGKDENAGMQTRTVVSSDDRLNHNPKLGSSIFNNKAVGVKQSPPSVKGSAIQPPIAPPPTAHAASLHQLFSTPTIFPPLELPVDFPNQREQLPHAEIKSPFLPDCTYFESAGLATFQTCPISGLCIASSPPPPFYVQNSLGTPLQPRSISEDGGSLYNSRSMRAACLSENGEMKCNPASPTSLSIRDTAVDRSSISPTSGAVKTSNLEFINEKDVNYVWDFPTVAVDGLNNMSSEHQPWSTEFCDTKLHESMEHEESFERLQLSHISTVQSLFDTEIISPESLSLSPQKEENPSEGYLYHVLKSAVQIWDDTDNLHKVPAEFVDCITQEIMRDPVITADGHSYERSAIEKWLRSHDTSPKTGEVLPPPPGGVGVDKTLRPNHILRGQIIEYKEKLAKMQPKAVSWSNNSKDDSFVTNPGSLSVLSF